MVTFSPVSLLLSRDKRYHFLYPKKSHSLFVSAELNTTTKTDIETQIAQLREDLSQKRKEATRSLRLPHLHSVEGKRPVFAAIKDGRFYAVSELSRGKHSGQDSEYDAEDVIVEHGPAMDVIEMRRNAGQVVKLGCEQEGKIASALINIDPSADYLSFAVYTNSFGEFNYVKALFVKKGFEYNWIVSEGAMQIVVQSTPHTAQ
jgi:hypothetical protein